MHLASPVALLWHRNILKGRKSCSAFITYARALQTVHHKRHFRYPLEELYPSISEECVPKSLYFLI